MSTSDAPVPDDAAIGAQAIPVAEERAGTSARRAAGRLGQALQEAGTSVGHGVQEAAGVLDDAFVATSRALAGALRGAVRAKPLCALAAAAGIAYLFGRLSR